MSMVVPIGKQLRQAAPNLGPAEAKVARVLIASGLVAGLETVAALSERAGVSGPTVLRLAGKLGYASFPDFQRRIRAELEERRTSPLSLFDKAEAGSSAFARNSEALSGIVAASLAKASETDIDRAAAMISDPRQAVYTTGGRFSRLIADMLFLHLDQLRPSVYRLQEDLQSRQDQVLRLDKHSLLIVFDVRRYEARTVEIVDIAKRRGAAIIAFTDPWASPIASHADVVLSADVQWTSVFDSIVPMTALCELVIAAVVEKLGDRGKTRMAELESLRTDYEWTSGGKQRRSNGAEDG